MEAVVVSPRAGLAVKEGVLGASAVHLIQPDGIVAPPKMSPSGGRQRCATAQLPADHCRIHQVPAIVTDCPPHVVVEHLHPPGAAVRAVKQLEGAQGGDAGFCGYPKRDSWRTVVHHRRYSRKGCRGAQPDGCCPGLPEHSTLASSTWLQLCSPHGLAWHSERFLSSPVQLTSSNQICPVPSPYRAPGATDSNVPQPNCWHTTRPSGEPQPSSHTVPHVPL